ncbi:hypothetical protein [Enterovibrio baiacu]|uniref:hypothetical protein n=1 Tax=Enterovibrio baiacu TaxID=2491023 RepID=UPI001010A086|nr:hypothetical protein [Enterovibrio baiacu]MBE1275269.1 hypothetical protein [Enterovibrio baiacu]
MPNIVNGNDSIDQAKGTADESFFSGGSEKRLVEHLLTEQETVVLTSVSCFLTKKNYPTNE